MILIANVLVALVAALHAYFLILEMFLWDKPLGLKTFRNTQEKAEITKVLVHPRARRRGLGRALMNEAEAVARAEGRSLLVLDTRSHDAGEALYRSLGYAVTGVVPDYACSPDGVPEPCTFMHKRLPGSAPRSGA